MKIILILLLLLPINMYPIKEKVKVIEKYTVIEYYTAVNYKRVYDLLPYINHLDSNKILDILSCAVVESGWNGNSLTKYNNWFGIKGNDIEFNTIEYKGDSLYKCKQSFKKFSSISDCIDFRLTKVRKMGTCPTKLYNSLQSKLRAIISKDIKKTKVKVYEIR